MQCWLWYKRNSPSESSAIRWITLRPITGPGPQDSLQGLRQSAWQITTVKWRQEDVVGTSSIFPTIGCLPTWSSWVLNVYTLDWILTLVSQFLCPSFYIHERYAAPPIFSASLTLRLMRNEFRLVTLLELPGQAKFRGQRNELKPFQCSTWGNISLGRTFWNDVSISEQRYVKLRTKSRMVAWCIVSVQGKIFFWRLISSQPPSGPQSRMIPASAVGPCDPPTKQGPVVHPRSTSFGSTSRRLLGSLTGKRRTTDHDIDHLIWTVGQRHWAIIKSSWSVFSRSKKRQQVTDIRLSFCLTWSRWSCQHFMRSRNGITRHFFTSEIVCTPMYTLTTWITCLIVTSPANLGRNSRK